MSRQVKIGAIQMDAARAPLAERLARADSLIANAAGAGAQLVVLPELFNTGYEYHDQNYALAEPMDGETATWMKLQAAFHHIYLAGSLLLRDDQDIYNAALLVAPDGRTWRYDKNYPFLWERAYFREGHGITIADTDLGKVGIMICWDCAHPDLWQRYAGKVDMLIVPSCPPKLSSADVVFPDGLRCNLETLGGIWSALHTDEEYFPGPDLDEHAAWLRVPVVSTVGGGTFRSRLPLPALSVPPYLAGRPDLWSRLGQAPDVYLEAGFDPQTKVIDANGCVLARVIDANEGFTVAEVTLADTPTTSQTQRPQPRMRTSALTYFLSDWFGVNVLTLVYRRGVRQHWGSRMAPADPRTRIWIGAVTIAAISGLVAGWFARRRND